MSERVLAALAIGVAVLAPSRLLRATPTVCLVRRLTGRPCPACGLSRSWNAAARLDLHRAQRLHPFGPATLAAALAFVVAPKALDRPQLRSAGVLAPLAAAWLGTWLVRLRRAAPLAD